MAQCKAKAKGTGKRCRNQAVTGYEVCRMHGANPRNRGGGPRPGNKNAVTHGTYETIIRDRLTEEEQAVFDSIDAEADLRQELRILRFKLLRLLGPVERQMIAGTKDSWDIVNLEVDEVTKAYAIEKLADGIRKIVKELQGSTADDPLIAFVDAIRQEREARKAREAE